MQKALRVFLSILLIFILFVSSISINSKAIQRQSIADQVALIADFAETFNSKQAYVYNERLTFDDFSGRQSGTEQNKLAAEWIRDQFVDFGLQPYQNSSYFQEFSTTYYDVLSPLHFEVKDVNNVIPMEYRKDFVVYPYSGSGAATSQVVFAGYGITDEESGYDDYEDIQVTGKTVYIVNSWPSFVSVHSWDGYNTRYKIKNAFEHGAVGVILSAKPTDGELVPLNMKFASGYSSELPCLYVNKKSSLAFFKNSQSNLTSLLNTIDESKKPQSKTLPVTVSFEIHTISETRPTSNVIGYIPAANPDSEESIVIGAHFDHLGKDLITGDVFRGANDNASGTAVMLELARVLQSLPIALQANIVFIAFSGEEEGLIGSQYYVKNPLFPLKNTIAMINLDMVGTGDGMLYAGTSSALYPDLSETIQESALYMNMDVTLTASLLYPGSDHYPFHMNKVPSVFFFQDNPSDIGGYHTLNDTMDSVDPNNLDRCGKLALLSAIVLGDAVWMELNIPNPVPHHPKMRMTGTVFGLEDSDLMLEIGDYSLPTDSNNPFEIVFPLQDGENQLDFKLVTDDKQVAKQFSYSIQAEVDENLIADFNQDEHIDVSDLALFSRYFGMDAPTYQFRCQFDCNLDQRIDEKDYQILESVWNYAAKK